MAFEAKANSENKSSWVKYVNPVNWFKKIWHFIVESKNEVKRITWPERSKIYRSAGVVITSIIVLALFVWLIDSLFNLGLGYFFKVIK